MLHALNSFLDAASKIPMWYIMVAVLIMAVGPLAFAWLFLQLDRRNPRPARQTAKAPESVRLVSLEGVREIRIVLVRDSEE